MGGVVWENVRSRGFVLGMARRFLSVGSVLGGVGAFSAAITACGLTIWVRKWCWRCVLTRVYFLL